MSFPFGGHPTLAMYLHWLREQGFSAKSGVASSISGRAIPIIRITKSEGPTLIIVGLGQNKHLTPTQLSNFDRRLGVECPWFTAPGEPSSTVQ